MLKAHEAREISKTFGTLNSIDGIVRRAAREGKAQCEIGVDGIEQEEGRPDPAPTPFGVVLMDELKNLGYRATWEAVTEFRIPFSGGISQEEKVRDWRIVVRW